MTEQKPAKKPAKKNLPAKISAAAPAVVSDQPANLLVTIARAAASPDVDAGKMQALLDMHERIERRDAEKEFNAALAELLPKIPTFKHTAAVRNKTGVQSTYTKYEDIDRVVRPLYTALGFSVSFTSRKENGTTVYSCRLAHRAGHFISAEIELPTDTGPGRNNVQAAGSTITYAKRYLLCMVLNIVTTGSDDDANGATAKITMEQAAEIDVLLRETNADRTRFFEFLGSGNGAYTNDVRQIEAGDYKMAITNLKAKKDAITKNQNQN